MECNFGNAYASGVNRCSWAPVRFLNSYIDDFFVNRLNDLYCAGDNGSFKTVCHRGGYSFYLKGVWIFKCAYSALKWKSDFIGERPINGTCKEMS